MRQPVIAIIVAATAIAVCHGCAQDDSAQHASGSLKQQLSQLNSDQVDNTQTTSGRTLSSSGKSSTAEFNSEANLNEYDALIENGKTIDIGGKAFSPGELPEDLSGVVFYPTRRSSLIQCSPNGRASILTPAGERTLGMYKVLNADHQLVIKYLYRGSEKSNIYDVTRGDNFALIKLREYKDEDKPLPLVAKALVK